MKEERPKHGVCPHQKDYCDQCKEFNEQINRLKTILNRLRHTGDSSEETLCNHEEIMKLAENELTEHKREAQQALEIHHSKMTGKPYNYVQKMIM